MSPMEITALAWLVVLLYAFTLIMVILFIYACLRRVVSSVQQALAAQANARAAKQRAREIRAAGRSARQHMQNLYDDYLTQVTQSRRR